MLGTAVNTVSILVGGGLGSKLGSGLSEKYSDALLNAVSVSVVVIGLKSAIETNDVLLMICSMALGSVIGEFLSIEDKLNSFSEMLERRFSNTDSKIAEGFMTATLIYCVGAMSIIGSIESGVNGNHNTLYVKSILDGISALVFSSTLGIGVPLAAISVFLYQGTLTLLSGLLVGHIPMESLGELSAVGGVLIMIIGLNVLKITKIKVGNMLPAVFIPVIYFIIKNYFSV